MREVPWELPFACAWAPIPKFHYTALRNFREPKIAWSHPPGREDSFIRFELNQEDDMNHISPCKTMNRVSHTPNSKEQPCYDSALSSNDSILWKSN